jgi:hypothetical protein
MNIGDIVNGLAAGVGIDLSPDGKTAYYVEWSIGEVCKVEVDNGKVTRVADGFKYPEDVEVDWDTGEIFVSERTGEITNIDTNGRKRVVANLGGAPHQLVLIKEGGSRYLYTVCFDSGRFIKVEVSTGTVTEIVTGLGHPIGLAIDSSRANAYITEQDTKCFSRIVISTKNRTVLYTGLTSPFYLAWNKDDSGLFCVQRDPSNSLVKLTLGSPVTVSTVASGLAWRPSGVMPNFDDSKIYICADQKMQVISFNGVPTIQPDPAPFEVYSIQFNYDRSEAISLKDHITDDYIHSSPEWIKATRNEPAAYVRHTLPHIKVVFRKIASSMSGTYAVGAIGNLGGIRRKDITPTFNAAGFTGSIDFELMWPLPNSIGKHNVTISWYARKTAGPNVPILVGSATHTICTTWQKMDPTKDTTLQDWVYKNPMLWTSEWAAGKDNEKTICDAIIQNLHQSNLKYGVGAWTVRDILQNNGGMCGGWYKMFQHLAHCQGVFVHRRCFLNNPRYLTNGEEKWFAIVIRSGGLNQPHPPVVDRQFKDINSNYPISSSTQISYVTEKRYVFSGNGDGHCINFLEYSGKLYLYDASFEAGPFEIAPFTGPDAPLPPKNYVIVGGNDLASFKSNYLDGGVDYMLGTLFDGSGTLHSCPNGLTVKTSIIPDMTGTFQEITFTWGI